MGNITLSIEAYGEKHSVMLSDETRVPVLTRHFVNLMCNVGFSRDSLTNQLKDGDPNHWDDAYDDRT